MSISDSISVLVCFGMALIAFSLIRGVIDLREGRKMWGGIGVTLSLGVVALLVFPPYFWPRVN